MFFTSMVELSSQLHWSESRVRFSCISAQSMLHLQLSHFKVLVQWPPENRIELSASWLYFKPS